jgi:hypothetical protein
MSKRKSPDTRQRRGTADAVVSIVPALADAGRPPPVPKLPGGGTLRASVRDWWVDYWSRPRLADRDDVASLARLASLYDLRLRAEAAYRKAPSSTGSTGQLVVNPFAKELASLDGRILALEDRFGLSPKSRLDLGAAMGDAAEGLERMNAAIVRAYEDEDDGDDPRVFDAESEEAG